VNFTIDTPTDAGSIAIYLAVAVFVVVPAFAVVMSVGFWALAKIPPLRWVLFSWARVAAEPMRSWLGAIVREETADIRKQVFPNGGGSIDDQLRQVLFELQERGHAETRVAQDFGSFEATLLEVRAQVRDLAALPTKVAINQERIDQLQEREPHHADTIRDYGTDPGQGQPDP